MLFKLLGRSNSFIFQNSDSKHHPLQLGFHTTIRLQLLFSVSMVFPKGNKLGRSIQKHDANPTDAAGASNEAAKTEAAAAAELPAQETQRRRRASAPAPTSREKAKLERMEQERDLANEQLHNISEELAELRKQLEEEKRRAHTKDVLARQWKARAQAQVPGPKRAQRLRQRAALEQACNTKLRRKNLRRMASDLDGYIKRKFVNTEDAYECMLMLLTDNAESMQQELHRFINRLPHLKKAVQLDIVRRIEKHWSVEIGLAIRLRCRMPERPYQYLIHALSHKYNEDTDEYDTAYVADGVRVPSLGRNASKDKTVALMNEYFNTAKPEALLLGSVEGVTLSFKEAMLEYIKQYVPESEIINVQLAGDGAGVFRGVSQTTVAFKVIVDNAERDPDFHGLNSPFSSQSVLVFEGKEAYHEVKEALGRLLKELQEIKDYGIRQGTDGKLYTVKTKGGGDMKWINMMCGLATCSHDNACSYCECAQNQLHLKTPHTLRTAYSLHAGAHVYHESMTFPWTCDYCPKTFESREALEAEPAPTSEKKRLEYQTMHKGSMWHRGPIMPDIPPEDMVSDVLHFSLREILHALEVTVRRRCTTQDKIDKLAEFLQTKVKCFIKIKKVKKKLGVKEEKAPNIIGRECSLTLQHSEAMVRTVLDETDDRFDRALEVWRTLKLLWREMTTRLAIDTPVFRAKKAAAIKQKASDYIDAVIAHGSAQDVYLYAHAALQHLPAQVLRHGDLLDYSMQGLEHLHSQRKTHMRHHGNKRKTGDLKSRTAQSAKLEVAHRVVNKSVRHRNKSRHLGEKAFRLAAAQVTGAVQAT